MTVLAHSSWLIYLLHYVIARTLYTWAVSLGVSPWVLVGAAVLGLLLLRRRWRGRGR